MGNKTAISWADATWNPVVGCTRVSPGCDHCYALKLHNRRHKANAKQAMIFAGFRDAGSRQLRYSESWPQYVRRVGPPAEGWATRGRKLGVKMPLPPQYDQPFS